MSDVHYMSIFIVFFLVLGLLSPLINSEFNSELESNSAEGIAPEDNNYNSLTAIQILLNLLLIPLWTFGLPAWVNLWILLPIRLIFIFVLGRNIWVGGGG